MIPDNQSRTARLLAWSLLILLAGLTAALLVAEIGMAPSPEEILVLAGYLSGIGLAALIAGWVLVADRRPAVRLSLRAKAFLLTVIGGLIGLANVLAIGRLMFTSTTHDLWVLATAVAFSIAVMAAFALFVASSVSRRVRAITSAIRSLANAPPDAPRRSEDEVELLAEDVRLLEERLAAADAERKRVDAERRNLTAAVSHDLRTPVASVRAMAEALSAGVLRDDGDRKRYVDQIQREMERMGRMIDDLFDLAQVDACVLKLDRRLVQVEDIVGDVLEGMRPQARERAVGLRYSEPPTPLPALRLDGARMERVVANLLRNAIAHTPEGGTVEVCLNRTDGWVTLDVRDTGHGFEPGQAEMIWNRFYRADTARGRSDSGGDGAGLGLAIVKGFVEAHGGKVSAMSDPGAGATFTVELPVGDGK